MCTKASVICLIYAIVYFTSVSCETKKMSSLRLERYDAFSYCKQNWKELDLHDVHRVRVYHHQKYTVRNLGLIIGVSDNYDTIGLMYKQD